MTVQIVATGSAMHQLLPLRTMDIATPACAQMGGRDQLVLWARVVTMSLAGSTGRAGAMEETTLACVTQAGVAWMRAITRQGAIACQTAGTAPVFRLVNLIPAHATTATRAARVVKALAAIVSPTVVMAPASPVVARTPAPVTLAGLAKYVIKALAVTAVLTVATAHVFQTVPAIAARATLAGPTQRATKPSTRPTRLQAAPRLLAATDTT